MVERYFNALNTFPFKSVVEIMNDHLRNLVRSQLYLMYAPYTSKQYNAISNLMNNYPYKKEDKIKVSDILKLVSSLQIALDKTKPADITSSLIDSVKHYTNRIVEEIYKVSKDYLWIVENHVTLVLLEVKKYLEKENTLRTALTYLDKYRQEIPRDTRSFEDRFTDDVTTCLIYTYPHPEQYFALKRAKEVMGLYFTKEQISKLFIDNIEYKIQRYLSEVEYRLGLDTINKIIDSNNKDELSENTDKQDTPLSEKSQDEIYKYYQDFLKVLNHYTLTGENIKSVLEMANELRGLPYDKVYTIKGFADNMALVDGLKLFS